MRRKGIWGATAIVVVVLSLYLLSPWLLMMQDVLHPAGAIVVLGGTGRERVFRAAEIYAQGLAPIVIVSGTGDCHKNKDRLILAQVPDSSILLDCESRNTAENAQYAGKILREKGVHTAIIVTSWWHTRRAMRSFRHFSPEIQFLAAPSYGDNKPKPNLDQVFSIVIEYVKIAYYSVRHGIS